MCRGSTETPSYFSQVLHQGLSTLHFPRKSTLLQYIQMNSCSAQFPKRRPEMILFICCNGQLKRDMKSLMQYNNYLQTLFITQVIIEVLKESNCLPNRLRNPRISLKHNQATAWWISNPGWLLKMVIFPSIDLLRASQVAPVVKNQPANVGDARDAGLEPWGRHDFPGGGNGNPLQYSCLENSMD